MCARPPHGRSSAGGLWSAALSIFYPGLRIPFYKLKRGPELVHFNTWDIVDLVKSRGFSLVFFLYLCTLRDVTRSETLNLLFGLRHNQQKLLAKLFRVEHRRTWACTNVITLNPERGQADFRKAAMKRKHRAFYYFLSLFLDPPPTKKTPKQV